MGKVLYAFCPPSFYGDRCQFNQRRVTVRVRFDRQLRSDLPVVLHVLVLLVCNGSLIVDHQRIVDTYQAFPAKHDIYLLYSHPKIHGIYSIRFEIYDTINLLSVREYSISSFDFLPAFRLAKVLHFTDRSLPSLCSSNYCKNNGTCYVINQNQSLHLCLCQRGWQGMYCEKTLDHIKCAAHALVRSQNVCVCPYGYIPPYCFIQNTVCKQLNPCTSSEVCFPLSILPPHQYSCLCNSSNCNQDQVIIVLNRKESNGQPFLLQLLKSSSDYPRVRQQILIPASTIYPTARTISTLDARHKHGVVPEIGLLYSFHPTTSSIVITRSLLYINCSNTIYNLTIDLDTQPQHCYSLNEMTHQHSTKAFHMYCRGSTFYPCFYSENYMCYCNVATNRSECISYRQRNTACTYCINQGYCVQGDLPKQK